MKGLIWLKTQLVSRTFFYLLVIAIVGGSFFLKNPPLKPVFDAPLPHPQNQPTLSNLSTDFQLEYTLAKNCLHERCLPTTLYSFKKAELLAKEPHELSLAQYGLIFTHFLNKNTLELKQLYLKGVLENLSQQVPYATDAAIMFYSAFKEAQIPFLTFELKTYLDQDPLIKSKLDLFEAITADKAQTHPAYNTYQDHKKSPLVAGALSLLPGGGYLYLHQYQSALTAFLLLSCLGWALYTLCQQKQIAGALIVFSIFTGFYWGSIVGSTQSAAFFNQTLYRACFEPILRSEKLYPELNIHYAP
jgi:hypothetical protein